ncbi:MAG: protein translocase subunit SecD [Candidatus Omnitrophica bacterium]|nr:protein translocase subunit SecD [Candidatus Omnitrophota bacterium]
MQRNLLWKFVGVLLLTGFFIWQVWPPQEKINLGLDLQGGMHVVLRVDTSQLNDDAKSDATDRAMEIVRNRIDQFGVSEPIVHRQGDDHIVLQLPGVMDRDRALALIGKTAMLEFQMVEEDIDLIRRARDGDVPRDYVFLPKDEGEGMILLERDVVMTGDALVNAQVEFDTSRFNEPYIAFELTPEAGKKFARVTRRNVGRQLAIILDGKVVSSPVIQSEIPSGRGQITGRFTIDQATDLAIQLRAGALPAPIIIEEERTVGPLLGQDSIRAGLRATVVGGILVILFMWAYYWAAGLVATVAVFLNIIIIMGALAALGATLTLPGIAGLILTIGMAVDANVLIYERIREELNLGKNLRGSISSGYEKAFSAILDSNVTTLIAAFLLFQFGTGPIRGFGVTLTIGLITSMFTAIVVTRLVFEGMLNSGFLKKLTMMHFLTRTDVDFLKYRKICFVISAVLVFGGLGFYFSKGDAVYGVDFSGGQMQEYAFEKPVAIDQLRQAIGEAGLDQISLQQVHIGNQVIVRSSEDTSQVIQKVLKEKFSDNPYQVLRIEKVGPAVGKDLRKRASLAIIWAMIGIVAYVGLRFQKLAYSLAGVLALFHDVFICLAALAFTGREVSLTVVAGLLAVAGYSINDTIVIYDRIRENLRVVRKKTFAEIINLSINQTLSRTVLTTLTSLLVVVALYFFGGEVINDFAFTLIVGFLAGIYSTIFIASPTVLALTQRGGKK